MRKYYSVIMGDIIDSRNYESQSVIHQQFNKLINDGNKLFNQNLLSPMTITLGDEFQGVGSDLKAVFKVGHAVRLRALTLDLGIRIVIGMAQIETPINRDRAWNMLGEGLAETREILNKKEDASSYHFYLGPERQRLQNLLDTLAFGLTEIETSWTKTQRDYVVSVLNNTDLNRTQLAEKLGISRPALYKNLKAARFDLYERFIKSIEETLGEIH